MKRTLLLLLALCMLLTACAVTGGSGTPSDANTVAEGTTTTSEEASKTPEEPSATNPSTGKTLLDAREAFDEAGVLWYIPNAQLEGQSYPTLCSFADNLLVTTNSYISDGEGELALTLLSAETGEVLQSCTVRTGGNAAAQLMEGYVAVCDSGSGSIVVLDTQLHEVARHNLTPDGEQWILGSDLDTLYICSYLNGIHAVSLSTGEEHTVLGMTELSVSNVTEAGICFTGVDLKTQRYSAFCLDLASGALTEPPFSGDFSRADRSGDVWLAGFYGEESTFAFGTNADARLVTAQNGTFSLLDPLGQLLFTGLNGELSLYDSDGTFLSSCALPGWYVQNFVWCEGLDGYLLLASNGEGSRLLFWDINAGTSGENLQTRSLTDYYALPGGVSADASLYERARAISDRFGVEICIADQCETEFPYFECYQISDYETISANLDLLENALSVFPEGFFQQLLYGHINRVQFQLVGGLSATNGFGGDSTFTAFTDTSGSVCRIVLDLYSIGMNSVWHELSHAIDQRLAWDAAYREGALFSEEGWAAHNPDDFSYSEDYGSMRSDIQSGWYAYFVDGYAMINATEDRARIFEHAIDNRGTLFQDEGLKEKLQ